MPRSKRFALILVTLAALAVVAVPAVAQTTKPAEAPAPALRELPPDAPDMGTPGAAATSQPGEAAPAKPKSFMESPLFFPMMLAAMVLLWVWSSRSRKKTEAKRKQMLSALKKGDKITSIGGIIGTVIEIRDDEVTVKVDETNNTRMKFARWAIRGVGESAKTDAPEDQK